MTKDRCLVLGGKGFIGSHLVDGLLNEGHFVRIFDRPQAQFLEGSCPAHENLEVVSGDFGCEPDIIRAVSDCDVCFHLVCTTLPNSSNLDPVFDIETNLVGTVRLLQHARNSSLRKIVFMSSGGTVYGPALGLPITEDHPTNPICSYGVTKLAIEKYLAVFHCLYGLDYTILRFSNLYGERQRILSGQGAVAVFLGKALRREKLEIWGDGSVIRDYLHVSDSVSALLAALKTSGRNERILNIGSGHGISLNEVVAEIERATGIDVRKNHLIKRLFDVPANVLAIDRAKQVLGWEPRVSFPEGLRRTVKWLEQSTVSSAFFQRHNSATV
jgi:UDP-glucose 4-epimerase